MPLAITLFASVLAYLPSKYSPFMHKWGLGEYKTVSIVFSLLCHGLALWLFIDKEGVATGFIFWVLAAMTWLSCVVLTIKLKPILIWFWVLLIFVFMFLF
jgi:hypothetical protein